MTQIPGRSSSLLFFGQIDMTSGRGKCFYSLKRSLGRKLDQTYRVWNDSALNAVMAKYDLFVNLHKHCASFGPITFRNSLLLSAGKVIVSDRAHPLDEAEYRGMMRFVPLEQISQVYRELVARRSYREEQREVHMQFQARFHPVKLMWRANVFQDWNLTVRAPGTS